MGEIWKQPRYLHPQWWPRGLVHQVAYLLSGGRFSRCRVHGAVCPEDCRQDDWSHLVYRLAEIEDPDDGYFAAYE